VMIAHNPSYRAAKHKMIVKHPASGITIRILI